MHPSCRTCALILGASVFSALSIGASANAAESYPTKPIRLVIGFGAGGITDVAGRVVAQAMSQELGQQIIIDNRPGAGGGIAANAVAQAPADGYTLLLGTVGTQVVNKMIYRKLPYDPATMTPVSLVSNSPFLVAVNTKVKAASYADLVTYSKSNPGKLNFGSAGNGSSPHLCLELLKLTSKAELTHVPFKSGAEAVNAVVAGQVDVVCDAITVIKPQATAGRLRMVVLASEKRSPEIPDVPASKEQGEAAFQVGSWNALLGPSGMAADKVEVLNKALAKAMAKPELRKRLADMGIDAMPLGVTAYNHHLGTEIVKWGRVVEAAGTKLD